MNIVLFAAEEVGRPIAAADPRARHLLEILRRQPGDEFDAGVVNGPVGKGRIRRVAGGEIEWEFAESRTPAPFYAGAAPLEPIELVVGLPRPQTARKILAEATAMGVRAIRFVQTEKAEKAYARSTLWTSGEWRRHVRAGMEQAFATREPVVTFGESLEVAFAAMADVDAMFALDNYESAAPLPSRGPIAFPAAVLVGGERGWSAAEREFFREQGVLLCHLGQRVLRTETACIAALAIVRSQVTGQ